MGEVGLLFSGEKEEPMLFVVARGEVNMRWVIRGVVDESTLVLPWHYIRLVLVESGC